MTASATRRRGAPPSATRTPDPGTPTFATKRDLQRRWGCSETTVNRMIASGALPVTRISGSVRVPIAAVEFYEASRTTRGGTTPDPNEGTVRDRVAVIREAQS